jgi:hypothetical protein
MMNCETDEEIDEESCEVIYIEGEMPVIGLSLGSREE